ncbi:hypothetical protein NIES4072_35710 [Nostoc commune NIES-4072]|uniref:Uncharacterized protein n=1 Tax=Nostoc commune NIES-4072 TaxID=2005467 RepID=A0A2R5FM99_NOSCO|nr:hypothetical protein NIES4070_55080 [Nostoc commune HK-02]GBG19902.1 hypothetical protein NIES4072_35710 [Nostoc commune NIES-4072]
MKITRALIYTKLNLLVALIIAKKNAEDNLRELLENSASEPTLDLLDKSKIRTPPRQSYALSPLPASGEGLGVGC